MFATQPILLSNLLSDVENAKIQLPDFQRGWVWDEDRIKALLASIAKGFPVGAIMTLQAGGDIKLKRRTVEGVDLHNLPEPASYLLDGQQRLTSLYQCLSYPGAVITSDSRKKRLRLWFYIDIQEALNPDGDIDSAIISVPEDKIIREDFGRAIKLDISDPDKEYEHHMIPTEQLMSSGTNSLTWVLGYLGYWSKDGRVHPSGNATAFIEQFHSTVAKSFGEYQLPVIQLSKDTPKEAVCAVFEKVNTGGVQLDVFELATASFAVDESFSLRDDWKMRKDQLLQSHGELNDVDGARFLQTIALLKTQDDRRRAEARGVTGRQLPAIGATKRDILNLELKDYRYWADKVQDGFIQAAKFLRTQYIFGSKNIPYSTQLISIAALYVELGSELYSAVAQERLQQWYWSGVFGEVYGGPTETLFANDLVDVAEFVRNNTQPRLLREATFVPERLISLRSRTSAAYKGVYALQLKNNARDWLSNHPITVATYDNENIDIHHIFPKAYCNKEDIDRSLYDSVINKTPLSATTNKFLGGDAPSEYLKRLEDHAAGQGLADRLREHWITPGHLQSNDFAAFFVGRGQEMLALIGKAMGRELGDGTEAFSQALADHGQAVENLYAEEDTDYDDFGEAPENSDAA